MHIINNLSGNHFQRLIGIARNSDTLHMVSPFLMESFDQLFDELKDSGVKHIHLVTTLKSNDMDLLRKANALHSFCSGCVLNGIQYQVYVDNKLHGKIYIASKNGAPTFGILTSANLTESGLNRNHEWGLWLDDPKIMRELLNQVFSVCSQPLSEEDIQGVIEKVDQYLKTRAEPERPKLDLSVSEFIHYPQASEESDIRYFIKPLGTQEHPHPETHTLSSEEEWLRFAKRKPRAVRVGDILICYAVGTAKLLGYFEVTGPPFFLDKEGERWPWSVQAKNLCPAYSEHWARHNNTVTGCRNLLPADEAVTYVGGKTLGALNYGSDKIRITERFAKHLIGIIDKAAESAE